MTRRSPSPSRDEIVAALAELRREADTTGRRPSVLALAHRVGLANTTFRRRFPDIVTELTHAEGPEQPTARDVSRYEQLRNDNARFRQSNRDLRDNLELAIANIQRLTLENHRLRQELQAASNVPQIRRQAGRV